MDLVRIDPSTNEVAERLDVSEADGIPDLATAYESVWLTDTLAGELVRVSSDGTEIQARISIGSGGQDLYEIDIAKGQVWAGKPFEARIYAINPTTDEFDIGLNGLAEGIAFAP